MRLPRCLPSSLLVSVVSVAAGGSAGQWFQRLRVVRYSTLLSRRVTFALDVRLLPRCLRGYDWRPVQVKNTCSALTNASGFSACTQCPEPLMVILVVCGNSSRIRGSYSGST